MLEVTQTFNHNLWLKNIFARSNERSFRASYKLDPTNFSLLFPKYFLCQYNLKFTSVKLVFTKSEAYRLEQDKVMWKKLY